MGTKFSLTRVHPIQIVVGACEAKGRACWEELDEKESMMRRMATLTEIECSSSSVLSPSRK